MFISFRETNEKYNVTISVFVSLLLMQIGLNEEVLVCMIKG